MTQTPTPTTSTQEAPKTVTQTIRGIREIRVDNPAADKTPRMDSPLLREMPPAKFRMSGRRQRIMRRASIIIPLIVIPLAFILIVQFRLLPEDGIGAAVYGFHDSVYLPLKGRIHTANMPFILIVWGILAMIGVVMIVSLLTDRSPTRGPQIALLRSFMYRPFWRGLLIAGARVLGVLRIRPVMLRNVADHELENTLLALNQPLAESSTLASKALNITGFLSALDPYSDDKNAPLETLEKWHFVYLLIAAHSDLATLRALLPELKATFENIVKRLPTQRSRDTANPFGLARLLNDLGDLIEIGEALAADGSGKLSASDTGAGRRLDVSIEARRRFLDRVYAALQVSFAPANARGAAPPNIALPAEPVPAVRGRLALNIAAHFAQLLGSADELLAYMDSAESVALLLEASDNLPQALANITPLVINLPDNAFAVYPTLQSLAVRDILVTLSDDDIRLEESIWQDQLRQPEGLVTNDDLRFERRRLAGLRSMASLLTDPTESGEFNDGKLSS